MLQDSASYNLHCHTLVTLGPLYYGNLIKRTIKDPCYNIRSLKVMCTCSFTFFEASRGWVVSGNSSSSEDEDELLDSDFLLDLDSFSRSSTLRSCVFQLPTPLVSPRRSENAISLRFSSRFGRENLNDALRSSKFDVRTSFRKKTKHYLSLVVNEMSLSLFFVK